MQPDRKEAISTTELHPQEVQLKEFFAQKSPQVILDIGACEGENSIRYARMFPQVQIYTFEALPKNYNRIVTNIKEWNVSNVKPIEIGLSNQKGTADFFVSSGVPDEFKGKELDWDFGNKSSSLLPPDETLEVYEWIKFKDKITVQTERLDNILIQHKVEHVDFIHLDVQGAELLVLEGSGSFINKIDNIWLEVEVVQLYKNQPVRSQIEQFFKEHGFVKILDSVDQLTNKVGDQFWSRKAWVTDLMGEKWVEDKIKFFIEKEIDENRRVRKHQLNQKIGRISSGIKRAFSSFFPVSSNKKSSE